MPVRISKNRVALENIPLNHAAEVNVASATTTNIGAALSNNVQITGTTTITAFDTVAAGICRWGRFAGVLTFTHNATSLILPGAANITTAANDRFFALSLGSGNWVVLFYEKASGTAIVSTAAATQAEMEAMASNTVFATPLNVNWHPGIAKAWIRFNGTGVIAINASHNITSITDDGVGKYTVTIATDFSSANYAALATAFNSATNAN